MSKSKKYKEGSSPPLSPIHIAKKQVYLPQQYVMYKDLALDSSSNDNNIFRFNFKQKSTRQTNLLDDLPNSQLSFEIAKHQQIIKKQKKLKQMKDYIDEKQKKVKEQKEKQSSKVQQQILKWKKAIDKKKYERMKHKVTLQPIQSPTDKKLRIFDTQNDDYISFVNSPLQQQSPKYHHNPQQFVRYSGGISPRSPMKPLKRSVQKYHQKLKERKEMQEMDLQKSIEFNIDKQRKIAEARELKKYIQIQKHKIIHSKSSLMKEKFEQNSRRIGYTEQLKKMELQDKLKSSERKKRNVSLPLMKRRLVSKNYEQFSNESDMYMVEQQEESIPKADSSILERLRSISVTIKRNKHKKIK